MSKYRSARAVLAGAAVIALAGCGASASTSGPGSGSTASASTASGSTGAGGSPSATPSGGATSSATSNSFVSAGSIPFPIAVGNTWLYQAVSGINNAHSLVTNRVLSVAPVPGGHRVTMSETISGGATTQQTYIFYANGQIGYPVNEANGVSVTDSGGVLWPDAADLASGRDYRSVLHVRVSNTVPAKYETANVTVRGGGTASVTVPAGTYQATIVDMVLAMKVGSFSTSVLVQTWIAPGTGPVKSEVSVLAAGKTTLTTTEELLTFTRG